MPFMIPGKSLRCIAAFKCHSTQKDIFSVFYQSRVKVIDSSLTGKLSYISRSTHSNL
jgi:hypothetical protein